MNVTVQHRQTLSDIAIQVYGDVRAVGILMMENNVSVTDDILPGTILKCPQVYYDRYLQTYVTARGITPATALEDEGVMPSVRIFTDEFTQEFN